jgi:hypothetical protein
VIFLLVYIAKGRTVAAEGLSLLALFHSLYNFSFFAAVLKSRRLLVYQYVRV